MELDFSGLFTKATPPEPCKGVLFRYIVNTFSTRLGVKTVTEVRLLKRRSCKGCESCGSGYYGMVDLMAESPEDVMIDPKAQHGDILEAFWVSDGPSTTWSGDPDETYYIELKLTPTESKQ